MWVISVKFNLISCQYLILLVFQNYVVAFQGVESNPGANISGIEAAMVGCTGQCNSIAITMLDCIISSSVRIYIELTGLELWCHETLPILFSYIAGCRFFNSPPPGQNGCNFTDEQVTSHHLNHADPIHWHICGIKGRWVIFLAATKQL